MAISEDDLPITISVPVFGKLGLGLEKNGSYDAAKAGIFPIIEVQGKKRVPVRQALRKIAGDDPEVLRAVFADFAAGLRRMKSEAA